jgi:hypothetical protein
MATAIGELVVEMRANTARFRADIDKANDTAKSFGERAGASVAKTQQAFQQVAQAGRTMAQTIASNVSPAVAEAATAIGLMTTSLLRLPISAGLAVSALAALAIVAQRLAQNLTETQEAQSKLFLAFERGDVSSLRQQLQALNKDFDLLRRQQINAAELPERLKNLDLRGAFESAIDALRYGLSKGLDDISAKAQSVGESLKQLIPREVAASLAAFNVQMQQAISSTAQFDATLAETVNDEDAFVRAIERSIAALKDQARATDAVNRLKAESALREARADALLSAEARAAEEARITDELKQQLTLTGDRVNLEIRQLRERARAGVLGIREREQAFFPAEPGIEEAARSEGLGAGIALDPETLARARAAVRGYDTALQSLRDTQLFLGDASSKLAAQQGLVAGQMQNLIDQGVKPQDGAITSLAREYGDLGRAMNALSDQALIDSLEEQRKELSKTSREMAIYHAQLQLSADASDAVRESVGEMAGALDDQRRVIDAAETVTQAFAAGIADLLIDLNNFDVSRFLKGIAKMITAMAIAELTAIALKAAIGALSGGGSAGAGVGTSDVLRSIPATASGGIVTNPQIRLVGEAGPEAIVPLSRMHDVGGGGMEVNIYTLPGETADKRQRTGPDGQQILDVVIRRVGEAIGDGTFDSVGRATYGWKRQGVSR